jgi:hypothetical protein
VRRCPIDTAYGTLRYHGSVDCYEKGGAWVLYVRLRLTFDKTARVNHADRIDLTAMELVATRRLAGDSLKVEPIHRVSRAITAQLLEDKDSQELPEIIFTVDKAKIENATYLGLAVTDGHRLWPISVTLR